MAKDERSNFAKLEEDIIKIINFYSEKFSAELNDRIKKYPMPPESMVERDFSSKERHKFGKILNRKEIDEYWGRVENQISYELTNKYSREMKAKIITLIDKYFPSK